MVYERVEHVFGRNHVAADQQFGVAHSWVGGDGVRCSPAAHGTALQQTLPVKSARWREKSFVNNTRLGNG